MQSCLKQLCAMEGFDLDMLCVDIKRRPWIDLSNTKEREKILQQIKEGRFDAIILSPPCSTFSRACWANRKGPRPVRSYKAPRGADTLTAAERRRCILGNIFADFTWEVLMVTSDMQLRFVLLEQPEDLGAMAYGPHAGERPASMWQWPAFADIMAKTDWKTFAFHQGNLGAGYPKPTRLLIKSRVSLHLPAFCYMGPPSFDDKGFYTGPLPMAKGMGSIRARQSTGPFKTSGTEMWPAKMCQWLASMIMSSWDSTATTASKEVEPDTQEIPDDSAESFPICQPEGARILGGFGPPRVCDLPGGPRDFHDGGGLCSPGRWPPARRDLADDDSWNWLRERLLEKAAERAGGIDELEREAFRMAAGGESGCRDSCGPGVHQGFGGYHG